MIDEEKLVTCYEVIGDVATEISQAYADFGDLGGYFLGQTSATMQLRLFKPLALEVSLYLLSILDTTSMLYSDVYAETEKLAKELNRCDDFEKKLQSYGQGEERSSQFVNACQDVVASDALWLSMQQKNASPQDTISDRGYIAIKNAANKIEDAVYSFLAD